MHTPLTQAVEEGNLGYVEELLQAGSVDPHTLNRFSPSRALKEGGAKRFVDGHSAVLAAIRGGKAAILRALSQAGVNLNQITLAHRTPLEMAREFHPDMAPLLEELGARASVADDLDLQGAVERGFEERALALLPEADQAARSRATYAAARGGLTALVRALVRAGIESKAFHGALNEASTWERLETIQALVEELEAPVNHRNQFGAFALSAAAHGGKVEAIDLLLRLGADATLGSSGSFNGGETAMHVAVRNGHGPAALRLLAAGADPLQTDDAGRTCLTRLWERPAEERLPFLRAVLERGLDPQRVPAADLAAAAKLGAAEVVKALEGAGCDLAGAADVAEAEAEAKAEAKAKAEAEAKAKAEAEAKARVAARAKTESPAQRAARLARLQALMGGKPAPAPAPSAQAKEQARVRAAVEGLTGKPPEDLTTPAGQQALVESGDLERLDAYLADTPSRLVLGDLIKLAAKHQQEAMVERLAPKVRGRHARKALKHAVKKGNAKILDTILAHHTIDLDEESFGQTFLGDAADAGHTDLVGLLIDCGADPNRITRGPGRWAHEPERYSDGYAPLINAVRNGHEATVRTLLARGAKPNLVTHALRTPWDMAVALKLEPVAFALEGAGGRTLKPEDLSLPQAAKLGEIARVRELLPDSEEKDRSLALIMAAQDEGSVELCREIASAGVDQEGKDRVVYAAAARGNVELLRYVLGIGGSPDAKVFAGLRAIHFAAQNGHVDVIRLLAERGANVDARTDDGDAPLHTAVGHGRVEATRLLIELGAKVNVTARDGSTPLSKAKRHERKDELLAILNSAGAVADHRKNVKKQVQAKVKKLGLSAYVPKLAAGEGEPGGSRFGGRPAVEAGEPWPACPDCAGPLTFFAQIDLGDVPKSAQKRLGKGLLQVLLCDACKPYTHESPGQLVRVVSLASPAVPEPPAGARQFPARKVTGFKRGKKDYPNRTYELGGVELSDEEEPFLRQLNLPGDKVGGWPHWIQDTRYPTCSGCEGAMNVLLLQLDSGCALPHEFGDGGAAYVLACPEHLSQPSFGYQCY